ncbi:hypothetical protein [Treponema pectinovorum]|uniref:hypothetical protein n=1 Tax=Treponema pectinovorum TaxID=164 RepID=UPI003D89BE7F
MKKLSLMAVLILFCTLLCFAKKTVYRYAIIGEQSCIIVDYSEKIPEERLSTSLLSLNTKEERFIGEAGFKEVRSFFYQGFPFIYADATKDENNPDMTYIDTWDDVIAYVRGKK